jgi:sporulation protein YlmC with PRC-barrel domain
MKKLVTVVTMLSVFAFLLTVGVLAQPTPGTETTRDPTMTRPAAPAPGMATTINEVYASRLIGASVKNPQGESLGKIDELLIDPKEARIKAAVVSVGGLLGIGAKSVAVPWNKLSMGPERDTVVVAMGKEELEQAPPWQKSER